MFNKSTNTQDNPKGNVQPSYTPSEGSDYNQPSRSASEPTGSYRSSMEVTSGSGKPSIISEDVVLTGNIKTPGALHIEGTVKGDLEVSSLTIGPTGLFEGNVNCKILNIRGKFSGTSVCRELMVASSAQIDAKITYQDLTLQRGAGLRGELHVANFAE
ncbi:MAG: polymer-forming cytoskeletal protein [Holophagales bacterium]|jgi:cytoskeletal protein CcmA (bactofilin family)|nr:polymer-forming cytoskeletal protein [Holophagales bacterium]